MGRDLAGASCCFGIFAVLAGVSLHSEQGRGKRTSQQPEPLCPAIKLAIWVRAVIAYWDSVETCLQAMFLRNEGAQL